MNHFALFFCVAPLSIVLVWLLVGKLTSRMGGWDKMARVHAELSAPSQQPIYESGFFSGVLGWVNYNNVLWVQLFPETLRMGVILPFRIGHPTLQIPRRAIEAGQVTTSWLGRRVYTVKVEGVSLKFRGASAPMRIKEWLEGSGS